VPFPDNSLTSAAFLPKTSNWWTRPASSTNVHFWIDDFPVHVNTASEHRFFATLEEDRAFSRFFLLFCPARVGVFTFGASTFDERPVRGLELGCTFKMFLRF
jgi:hypothetical protein